MLSTLCRVSKSACDSLSPLVRGLYDSISGETAKLKADKSVFTVADGLVQHLLVNHLFTNSAAPSLKFKAIVGEEEGCRVDISSRPYRVDDLTVPADFWGTIDSVREAIDALSTELASSQYRKDFENISVFIDPIDGTREFSVGLGEQCSICIGFSDASGNAVAGIVYRPIPAVPTWALGAVSEGLVDSHLDMCSPPNVTGFLTSNGAISPFIEALMKELNFQRVPSGGAGNKMLMLLEGKGGCYLQVCVTCLSGTACIVSMMCLM